jgi:predicted RecA/RadA family phage recombinase
MATNFRQPGDVLEIVAGATIASGAGVLFGVSFGVAQNAAVSGERIRLRTSGVFNLPKAATIAPAPGALLYWDNAASNVTTTVGSNTKIGFHAGPVASGAGDATVPVRLNGAF